MTLAEQFVQAFHARDDEAWKDAILWGAALEEMEEDGLAFFHFADGSTAGVRTADESAWVQENALA